MLNPVLLNPVQTGRLEQQLAFLREIDRLKTVVRQSPLLDKSRKENSASEAAARLFGLLPAPQGEAFLALWHEFERAETDDARFAKALDRFQPLLINVFTEGGTWTESGVSLEQVFARYGPAIQRGAPQLWTVCEEWVTRHFAAH